MLALLPSVSLTALAALVPQEPAPDQSRDERTRFHRAPKPLAKDAVVEDSPGFLGARRTPHSLERPLAKRFEKDELPLVWERASGSGYAAPATLGELQGPLPSLMV